MPYWARADDLHFAEPRESRCVVEGVVVGLGIRVGGDFEAVVEVDWEGCSVLRLGDGCSEIATTDNWRAAVEGCCSPGVAA